MRKLLSSISGVVVVLVLIYFLSFVFLYGKSLLTSSLKNASNLALMKGGESEGEIKISSESILVDEKPCDAFSGGFTPKDPLFGSARVTNNTGDSVTVEFTQGPATIFGVSIGYAGIPHMYADLFVAQQITHSRAEDLCEAEKWDDKPCKLESKYFDGDGKEIGSKRPPKLSTGPLRIKAVAVYTCTCDLEDSLSK